MFWVNWSEKVLGTSRKSMRNFQLNVSQQLLTSQLNIFDVQNCTKPFNSKANIHTSPTPQRKTLQHHPPSSNPKSTLSSKTLPNNPSPFVFITQPKKPTEFFFYGFASPKEKPFRKSKCLCCKACAQEYRPGPGVFGMNGIGRCNFNVP